jgi:pilus assembly protein CpaE
MAKILVVEDTADTRNLIRIKLSKAGHDVVTAEDGEAGLKVAFAHKPQLVILDVMLPKLDGFSVARRLRATPSTKQVAIMMLTAKGEIADKVSGFQAGADDYLTKPFDPNELELRVRSLLARVAAAAMDEHAHEGHLISVFGLRGGVGKTTLAVNLAVTLAQLWNRPVPLLDLALQSGDASVFLGLRPKATINDLVEHYQEFPDAESLRAYFTVWQNEVRVLAAPSHMTSAERITPQMLKYLLHLIRADAVITLADVASKLDDQSLAVLDASNLVLLVMAPEVASVRTVVQLLDTFQALEYPKEKIQIVVNQPFKARGFSVSQIESALGRSISLVLPHDAELCVHAINTGEPLVVVNPNSLLTRALQDYAYEMSRAAVGAGADATPLAKAVQARLKVK